MRKIYSTAPHSAVQPDGVGAALPMTNPCSAALCSRSTWQRSTAQRPMITSSPDADNLRTAATPHPTPSMSCGCYCPTSLLALPLQASAGVHCTLPASARGKPGLPKPECRFQLLSLFSPNFQQMMICHPLAMHPQTKPIQSTIRNNSTLPQSLSLMQPCPMPHAPPLPPAFSPPPAIVDLLALLWPPCVSLPPLCLLSVLCLFLCQPTSQPVSQPLYATSAPAGHPTPPGWHCTVHEHSSSHQAQSSMQSAYQYKEWEGVQKWLQLWWGAACARNRLEGSLG